MSPQSSIPPLSPEAAVAYYRANVTRKSAVRVDFQSWKPILIVMIKDRLALDEIHEIMTLHASKLGYRAPAKTTLRDWHAEIRKEIGKPRRKLPDVAVEPELSGVPPATPEAAGDHSTFEDAYKSLKRNSDNSIKPESNTRKLKRLEGFRI